MIPLSANTLNQIAWSLDMPNQFIVSWTKHENVAALFHLEKKYKWFSIFPSYLKFCTAKLNFLKSLQIQ